MGSGLTPGGFDGWLGPSLSGGGSSVRVVTVPFAATINLPFPAGSKNGVVFDILLTGNAQIANPTGFGASSDANTFRLRVRQDAVGGRTLTWGTAFQGGTDLTFPPVLSAAPNLTDEMLFSWTNATGFFRMLALARGYAP